MACHLRPDPTFTFNFLTATGAVSTVFVESDIGTALIESATFNGVEVVPTLTNTITFKALAGLNILTMTIFGAVDGDRIRFKEDCGDGTSTVQKTFDFSGNPVRFQINAS